MHTSSSGVPLSEFVQAGLLGGTQVQAGHIFETYSRSSNDDRSSEQDTAEPLWSSPQTVWPEQSRLDPYQSLVDDLVHHIRPHLGLSTGEQQQALTVPYLQSPLGGQGAGDQLRREHDRRQASNREHQRRFRQRQKARSQAVEAQLVRTTTELQQLKARQAELELLLQKTYSTQKQSMSSAKGNDAPAQSDGKNTDGTPLLCVSIRHPQQHMSTEEVVNMTVSAFSELWAEYIRQMGACLLQMHSQVDSAAEARMQQLTFEAIRLVGRRLRLNPSGHRALLSSNASLAHAPSDKLQPQYYTHLLGLLSLSEAQFRDIMLLRKLFLTKRCLLRAKRNQLMVTTPELHLHPSDNVTRMTDLAEHLKHNASEDQRLLYQMSRAFYCGVLTMKQTAEVMVHSYPKMPVLEDLFNTFAAEKGFSSAECIEAQAHLHLLKAEWAVFAEYTKLVDPDYTITVNHEPLHTMVYTDTPADTPTGSGLLNLH